MCGIAGIFEFGNSQIGDPKEKVSKMMEALVHRGPDDYGQWEDPEHGIYLGHRRLSILDLSSRGRQPLVSPQGNVISYNGEIYNYEELKLQLPHHNFISRTDTEVALASYDKNGAQSIESFNGMFAIAIWDAKNKTLLLARDRLGIKPLYYYSTNDFVAFASEPRALLKAFLDHPSLNQNVIGEFLLQNSVTGTETLFDKVQKIEPATTMTWSRSHSSRTKTYWEVSLQNSIGASFEEASQTTLTKLSSSVNLRKRSDVPVGVFLSGGVDSSSLLALLSRQSDQQIHSFSVGFSDVRDYDESQIAANVARQFGAYHHALNLKSSDLVSYLPKVVECLDEPVADPTTVPIYLISQMARENNVPVILSGDGADELFFGYRNWLRLLKAHKWYEKIRHLPRPLLLGLNSFSKLVSSHSQTHELLTRASNNRELVNIGANGIATSILGDILDREVLESFNREFFGTHLENLKQKFEAVTPSSRRGSLIDWMCYWGLKEVVPDKFLHRLDRLAMEHSIEARVPFLDHNLVEFAMSIPSKFKTQNNTPKSVLKKSLEGVLSPELLYRKKMGFCVPIQYYLRKIITPSAEKEIDDFAQTLGVFQMNEFRKILMRFRKGDGKYSNTIWSLYFLKQWHMKWIS